MAEFSIIERFCSNLGVQHGDTNLTIGDDAAVITVPKGMELAISADTMVEGVHFFPNMDPALLAHKILAVNLSDMAAMGAEPKWATLALTLPQIDEAWLSDFSSSINRVATAYNVQIIGGDTTQGPLNLCLNIMGVLPAGQRLTRAGANLNDELYVSNNLGDAALALAGIKGELEITDDELTSLKIALETPVPQVTLGQSLLKVATSCLDVSDGLLADLAHIAKQSDVSFEVDVEKLPLSQEYQKYVAQGGDFDLALTGGDDYQLAFTVSPESQADIQQLSTKLNTPLTKIGKVVEAKSDSIVAFLDGKPYAVKREGYEHFSS